MKAFNSLGKLSMTAGKSQIYVKGLDTKLTPADVIRFFHDCGIIVHVCILLMLYSIYFNYLYYSYFFRYGCQSIKQQGKD